MFKEYHKIQSIFKRSEKTHKFIMGEYSTPEFEYLKNNIWIYTEKVDGTNIRVCWDGEKIRFAGRTDRAQIPTFLYDKLTTMFLTDKMSKIFGNTEACLYGEGYGARIQKGGGNYIPDGVSFVLFDVMIDNWWLKRKDVEDIARKLNIAIVPIVGSGDIKRAINMVYDGFESAWGDFIAEGLVLRPLVELKDRGGRRIITKMKYKDFEH